MPRQLWVFYFILFAYPKHMTANLLPNNCFESCLLCSIAIQSAMQTIYSCILCKRKNERTKLVAREEMCFQLALSD